MGKKKKESAEIKVHKLEIEKLKLEDKLKKEKSDKGVLLVFMSVVVFLGVLFLIGSI